MTGELLLAEWNSSSRTPTIVAAARVAETEFRPTVVLQVTADSGNYDKESNSQSGTINAHKALCKSMARQRLVRKAGIQVVVVDDDADIRRTISMILSFAGLNNMPTANAASAIEKIARYNPDLCICDIFMPGMGGLQLIETLRRSGYGGKILAISAGGYHRSFNVLEAANILGANATLRKPFEISQFLHIVGNLISTKLDTKAHAILK